MKFRVSLRCDISRRESGVVLSAAQKTQERDSWPGKARYSLFNKKPHFYFLAQ